MTKKDLKECASNVLIVDAINTYANLIFNYNVGRGIKQYDKHFRDCCEEMIKRGLITEEDAKHLNS